MKHYLLQQTQVAKVLMDLSKTIPQLRILKERKCQRSFISLMMREVNQQPVNEMILRMIDGNHSFDIFFTYNGQRHTNFLWEHNRKEILRVSEGEFNQCNLFFNREQLDDQTSKKIEEIINNHLNRVDALMGITADYNTIYYVNPMSLYNKDIQVELFKEHDIIECLSTTLIITNKGIVNKMFQPVNIVNKVEVNNLLREYSIFEKVAQ